MMPENLDEHRTRTGRKKAEDTIERAARSLATVRQAAVKVELLTGDPNWDFFIQYIQAAVNGIEPQIADTERTILDPAVADPIVIQQAKNVLAELRGRRDALVSVIELPKELISDGLKAGDLLRRMSKDDARTAS